MQIGRGETRNQQGAFVPMVLFLRNVCCRCVLTILRIFAGREPTMLQPTFQKTLLALFAMSISGCAQPNPWVESKMTRSVKLIERPKSVAKPPVPKVSDPEVQRVVFDELLGQESPNSPVAKLGVPMIRASSPATTPLPDSPQRPISSQLASSPISHSQSSVPSILSEPRPDSIPMDFQTSLSLIGGDHPVVASASARVQQAYAEMNQAEILWLPSLRAGISYHHHDGPLQASDGTIVDTNRGSLQAGLGSGAVAAGTTPQPGIVAHFHAADALFAPRIAERTLWANKHAHAAVYHAQLRNAAVAYNRLLAAKQRLAVIQMAQIRVNELAKMTESFAEAGEGLRADADRMMTEQRLVETRIARANEQVATEAYRLAEALSLGYGTTIEPTDPMLIPIYLQSATSESSELITTGFVNRPELKEAGCLVAAAVERLKRERLSPMVPNVLMGVSPTGFGGGRDGSFGDFGSRTDVDLMAVWQVRNLGLGEQAAQCRTSAQLQETRQEQLRRMDQIAREIGEASTQIGYRAERISIAQRAIENAKDSERRNLQRIKEGQGIPLEALQSLQALESAQVEYVDAVGEHNESQFQLQWALGWPINS